MTIFSTLRSFASEWQAARNEARTRRLIAGLPAEIRKDIGWPGTEGGTRRTGAVLARPQAL